MKNILLLAALSIFISTCSAMITQRTNRERQESWNQYTKNRAIFLADLQIKRTKLSIKRHNKKLEAEKLVAFSKLEAAKLNMNIAIGSQRVRAALATSQVKYRAQARQESEGLDAFLRSHPQSQEPSQEPSFNETEDYSSVQAEDGDGYCPDDEAYESLNHEEIMNTWRDLDDIEKYEAWQSYNKKTRMIIAKYDEEAPAQYTETGTEIVNNSGSDLEV